MLLLRCGRGGRDSSEEDTKHSVSITEKQLNFYVYRDLVLRTWKQRLLHALKRMFTALCLQKLSATELTKI